MLKGINNKFYFDLESYVDLEEFDSIQPNVVRGLALAGDSAQQGAFTRLNFDISKRGVPLPWKPLHDALDEFLELPKDDPIKINGWDLWQEVKDKPDCAVAHNNFCRYLKFALNGYDPYTYYYLLQTSKKEIYTKSSFYNSENPNKEEYKGVELLDLYRSKGREDSHIKKYFPELFRWVVNLKFKLNIFEEIYCAYFFTCEHDCLPYEHRDKFLSQNGDGSDPNDKDRFCHNHEFIHIRPKTCKPFYLWDEVNKKRTYMTPRVIWFNDNDWHGGDPVPYRTYSLRIDGKFTKEFKEKIGVSHLKNY